MIRVTPDIALDESEIRESFIRSPGPGGQNVNKVATSVQLRFDAARSPALDPATRARLLKLAGARATTDGEVVITARRFRTRERNREDALDRLLALIRAAAERPRPRRKTRPTLASKRRRLDAKRRQGQRKRDRRGVGPDD